MRFTVQLRRLDIFVLRRHVMSDSGELLAVGQVDPALLEDGAADLVRLCVITIAARRTC